MRFRLRWSGVLVIVVLIAAGVHAPAAAKRSNMPLGWRWPPSPAMKEGGRLCRANLKKLGVRSTRAKPAQKIVTPILVPAMAFGQIKLATLFRKPPFVMDCHLALAFARHAKTLYELGVRELQFSTIHDYRTVMVGGHESDRLSRHALGLAVDVFRFADKDGNVVIVKDHYKSNPWLAQIEDAMNNTGGFRMLLTPKNDPLSHYDHFHFEALMEIPGAKEADEAQKAKIRAQRRAHNKRIRDRKRERAKERKARQRTKERKARQRAKERKATQRQG